MSASNGKLRQPGLIVYFSGVGTSALVLWLVYYLNDSQRFNVMGWYVNGILPVGALLVGVLSGSGYAIASRYLHVKISRTFVLGMIATAILDYTAAQYLTYTNLLERLHIGAERYTFVEYVRDMCEKMAFTEHNSDKPGAPLGVFGYAFKLLEIAGYTAGAMFPSLKVSGMPYCRKCQQYLAPYRLRYINSNELWAEIKKAAKRDRTAGLQKAINAIAARMNEILGSIRSASLPETETVLAQLDSSARKESAARISVNLKKCPDCDAHHLTLTLNTYSADKKPAVKELAKIDKTEQAVVSSS